MNYEELFSVGFDRSYGGFDYAIKYRDGKLTAQEFGEIVKMTFHALRELERLMVEDETPRGEEKK